MHHTATKGNIGVANAMADLLMQGWDVLTPICSTSPFDLVAYRAGGDFVRIQVKYRMPVRGALEVRARRWSITASRAHARANTEIDVVCVYDAVGGECYYVPVSLKCCALRMAAPKNGQKRGLHLAADYRRLAT